MYHKNKNARLTQHPLLSSFIVEDFLYFKDSRLEDFLKSLHAMDIILGPTLNTLHISSIFVGQSFVFLGVVVVRGQPGVRWWLKKNGTENGKNTFVFS